MHDRPTDTTNADHATHLAVLRAAIADPRAFEPLYQRYAEDVYYFCYRRLAHPEEDTAQIATVIEWRWNNFLSARSLRPLNTVMTITDATHEGTTAMLAFNPHGNPRIWRNLLHSNDLMPFAVDRETANVSASPVATPES